MNRLHVIFMFLYLSVISPILAQSQEKLEKAAEKLFYTEQLLDAMDAYNEILKIDSRNKKAMYRLEICSLVTVYRTNSINNLLKYKKTQGKKDKFYYYWLGRAYYQQNKFKKSIESWNKFLSMDKYKSKEITAEVENLIKLAEVSNTWYSHPESYELDQLPASINSNYTEYSPVFFKEKNELLFLSSRKADFFDASFQVYHATQNNGKWNTPTVIEKFGYFKAKNANIEVVGNLNKLFVYKGEKKGTLLYSIKEGSTWNELQPFNRKLGSAKLESHFFMNEKETRILFAHRKSNKPHDLDIYESRKGLNEDKWGKPTLFSPTISSEKDEDFPFLTLDEKTIYFSSRGFGSIGEYDIFRSNLDETTNTWSEPISLKYPTNTIDDDIQFKIIPETNSGYFVSDRLESNGSFDVFFFHVSEMVSLQGKVVDGVGKPADHAEIHFYPSRTTGHNLKAMTDVNGNYKVKVGNDEKIKVEILFHDKIVHEETINTPAYIGQEISIKKDFSINEEKQIVVEVEFNLEDPKYGDLEAIGSKFRASNRALLSNVYFGFNEYYLNKEDQPSLQPLVEAMKENEKFKIEISGHTDAVGDAKTNLRISLLRAQSVALYIVSQGIEKERIVAKGFGSAKPIASNDQEEEGRELNRRIEVLVLE